MKITIDRIESNIAVVELEDMTIINVPVSLFTNAKEGDVYNITKDVSEMNERKKELQNRFDRLKK